MTINIDGRVMLKQPMVLSIGARHSLSIDEFMRLSPDVDMPIKYIGLYIKEGDTTERDQVKVLKMMFGINVEVKIFDICKVRKLTLTTVQGWTQTQVIEQTVCIPRNKPTSLFY